MSKVQTGFYQKWRDVDIKASYNVDTVLDTVIEYVEVDTISNTVQITLPDATSANIVNGKTIWIIDEGGNAATNNITIIPNPSDSTTIELESSLIIKRDNVISILELVEDQWVQQANTTKPELYLGAFSFHGNATTTVIASVSTYVDIAGTGVASSLNNNFDFATAPNTLTYTGDEDITVLVSGSFAIDKASAAERCFRIALFKNGSEVTEINMVSGLTINAVELSFDYPLLLVTDDELTLQIMNETNTENVLVTDLLLTVNRVNP